MPHIEGGANTKPHINRAPDGKPHFDRWANGSAVTLTPYKLGPAGRDGVDGLDGVLAVDNDTAVASYVASTSSLTREALGGRFAGRSAGFLPAIGGYPIMGWDDFKRPDVSNLAGTYSPSGQKYNRQGVGATPALVDNQYKPVVLPGEADILYMPLQDDVVTAHAKAVYNPGTGTATENFVVGMSPFHFGSEGSVQFAIYPGGKEGSSPRVDWSLFYVPVPIVEPYPVIGSGQFAGGVLGSDGVTEHEWGMRKTGSNQVTIDLPAADNATGLHTLTFTNSNIDLYWGKYVGIQLRRNYTTDGDGGFTGLLVGGVADAQTGDPPFGAWLHFDGTTGTIYETPSPTWTRGDLDLIGYVGPDDWSPTGIQSIMSQWDTGQQSFYWGHATTGNLTIGVSTDGTTSNTQNSSVNTGFTDGRAGWVRVTYRASDGQTIYYTSTDPPSTPSASVTWTQLGTTRTTGTGGAPFTSTATIQAGSRDGTQRYIGRIGVAEIRNGIGGTLVASVDFRGKWNGTGAAGNQWGASGTGLAWVVAEESVPNLASDLQSLPGGVSLTGTPSSGQVPTATSGSAATWQSPAAAKYSAAMTATPTAIANTTTDTTFWTPATLAAGSLVAGTTRFRFHAAGNLDEKATSGIFTLRFKLGAVTVISCTISPSVTSLATGVLWDVLLEIVVETTGAGGVVSAYGTGSVVNTAAGARNCVTFQAIAVSSDLSGGFVPTATAVMGTADAANIIRPFRASLDQVA